MAKSKTVNIWKIFENLSKDFIGDLHETDKEKQCEDQELRQWAIDLIKFIKNLISVVKKSQFLKNLLFTIQLMVTVFAAVSVTWSAALNLAILGFSGYALILAVSSIAIMSLYVCLLTAAQNFSNGFKEKEILRYQKLRTVEVKLFRSPDLPDAETGKTRALVEYMSYYAIEKRVYEAIYNVSAYNTRIDDQLLRSVRVPIELRARMAFAMSARMSAESSINQRRVRRLIRSEYINLYEKINRDSKKDVGVDDFIKKLYKQACSKNISEEFIREVCPEEGVMSADEWVAKVIVMYSLCRFAFFAREHGNELDKILEKEENPLWTRLSKEEKAVQKLKAFRWSIKQNLKRQNKKVSNAFSGYFFFIQIALPCFWFFSAILPAGFGILASSPVTKIVSMLGRGMETQLCTWFWLCGAANYMISSRKEVGKVWRKLFELISKKFIQKESSNPEIEKHTLRLNINMAFRFLIAISMAYASTLFMKAGVSRILDTPSLVGGDFVFALLFIGWMPWLKPLFLPLCAFLSMVGAVLSYYHVAKYYSDKHIPMPKRGKIYIKKQIRWKEYGQLFRYLWGHNFNFKKNRVSKILKLVGSIIAVLQTMVFYVSAMHMVGSGCAILLMPSVFLIISATNRKNIDSGVDFYHLCYNQKFFNVRLSQRYPEWFTSAMNSKRDTNQSKNRCGRQSERLYESERGANEPILVPPRLVRQTSGEIGGERRVDAIIEVRGERATVSALNSDASHEDKGSADSKKQLEQRANSCYQKFQSPGRLGVSSCILAKDSPTGVADGCRMSTVNLVSEEEKCSKRLNGECSAASPVRLSMNPRDTIGDTGDTSDNEPWDRNSAGVSLFSKSNSYNYAELFKSSGRTGSVSQEGEESCDLVGKERSVKDLDTSVLQDEVNSESSRSTSNTTYPRELGLLKSVHSQRVVSNNGIFSIKGQEKAEVLMAKTMPV